MWVSYFRLWVAGPHSFPLPSFILGGLGTSLIHCGDKWSIYQSDQMNELSILQAKATDFIMVKWSSCSALCFNNHRTTDTSGNKLKFYHLPRSTELQREYSRILQATGINWNSAYICSQHWSKGFRQVWQKCWAGKLSLPHDFHWSHLPFKGKLHLIVVQLLWLQLLAVASPLGKQDDPVTGSLLLSWKIWSWNTWKPWKSWKMFVRK